MGLQSHADYASIDSMDSDSSNACYQKALHLLSRRDHSCAELIAKLKTRSYGQPEIDAAIRKCRRLNYLDDARFAEMYARQLERKGFGINGIRHKLYLKGIPKTVIDKTAAAYESDHEQLEQCRRVLAKKLKPRSAKGSIADQKPKLQRFLFNRGFSGHIIRQVIDEATLREDSAFD